MIGRSDVEARPDASDEDLLTAATRGKAVRERTTALKELLRRRSDRVRPLLGKMVSDPAAPPEVRTTAAVALGTEATPENEEALLRALGSGEPAVVAAAASSLARIGGRNAFDALGALSRVQPETRSAADRSVAFARTLISYRLGLGAARLEEPPAEALLDVDRERAVPLRVEEVGPEVVRAARPSLERELPVLPVAEEGSIRFSCGGERLWIVPAEDVAARGASALAEQDRVAAVVMKESACPDGWYVAEYVLTHPRGDKGAAVFGVRSTGRVVHFGEVHPGEQAAAVEVRTVDAPGVQAVELRGELRDTFTIREALCSRPRGERRNLPSRPRSGGAGQGSAPG